MDWILRSAVFAFLMAFLGWMLKETQLPVLERIEISIYRALSVNALSDLYGRPIWSDADITTPAKVCLFLARWAGVVTFTMLLVKAYQGLFSEQVARMRVRRLRDHIVIIGDTEFARAAGEEATKTRPVVWATDDGITSDEGNLLRLGAIGDGNALMEATAAHKAHAVLVSLREDARTFGIAREMLSTETIQGGVNTKESEPLSGPHFFAVVSDRWDAYPDEAAVLINPTQDDNALQKGGGYDSVGEFITEARTAARAALGNAPLFLLAGGKPQHALVLGFGDFGEALVTELCENQRTDPNSMPRITIVDRDRAAWDRFVSRVPDYADVFRASFFEVEVGATSGSNPVWQELLAHLDRHHLTTAYVATGRESSSRLSASELRIRLLATLEHSASSAESSPGNLTQALAFPIFAYSREATALRPSDLRGEQLRQREKPEERMPIIPFGAWSEIVSAARLFDPEPDAHAFEIHATYHRLFSPAGTPVPRWRSLPEMSRYSSRSAAAYTPALLHAAGYDLTSWYAEAQSSESAVTLNNLPRLASIPDFKKEKALLMKLARLEHARWCAERRMKGYRYGPTKDQARRHHPDLVEFDDLGGKSQRYNIGYIESLFSTLAQRKTDLVVQRRIDAPQAIARPTDVALLKKLGIFASDAGSETEGNHGDV